MNTVERSADHEGELRIQERFGVREPAEAVIVRQATEVAMPPGLESSLLQFLRSC